MKIAVYCASSTAVAAENLTLGFDLGAAIASRGHELVWGGGAISVMGEVAKGARSQGGRTIGVIPERLMNVEFIDHDSTELHVVADMRARKGMIENLADSFIALPGGIGTLEELFEIWVGRYLKFHNKPVIILDPYGIYQPLHALVEHLENEKFVKPGMRELLHWTTTVEEAVAIAHGAR